MNISKPLSLLLITLILSSATAAAFTELSEWVPMTVGDSLGDSEEEFDLDSETNRRILATKKYISYGALKRNTVPCSRRGASYYNCRKGAQANPYTRGCSAITRCRS